MDNNNSNSIKARKEHDTFEKDVIRKKPEMGRINVLRIVLYLIFLATFNVFFFVLGGTEHNTAVWMSYGSIHFAYLMLVSTSHLTPKGKSSVLFGLSLYYLSAVYFFAALVAGIILIMIAPESYTTALLIQLSIAGLYGVALIAHMIANKHTAEVEEKRQYQIEYVKNATAQLKRVLDRVKDKDTKKVVEKAYDAISSSPVKSHANLEQIERRILTLIDELNDAVTDGNKQVISLAVDSLMSAVSERNSRLKAVFNHSIKG